MSSKESTFQNIAERKHFIIGCYTEMLTRINEQEIIPLITNDIQDFPITDNNDDENYIDKAIQSLSIYFQLMTLVEENAATHYRRKMENQNSIASLRGSWGEVFEIWRAQNLDENDMLHAISEVNVMPVLTAHPTEAKRVSVIEIHRELYLLLVQRENISLSKLEKNENKEKIINLLERWWRTGEIYLEKPDVRHERANTMYYLNKIFPTVLEKSDQQLKWSWIEMGFNPNKIKNPNLFP